MINFMSQITVPFLSGLSGIKTIFTNEAIIAVLSASLFAPLVVPKINSVMDSMPILRDHKSLASLIAGVLMFSFVATIKTNSILKAIGIGISGAFILTAVLPLYTQITTRGSA
jgi:hypothetical protein